MPFDKWFNPFCGGIMNTTVTLDRAGRGVIPKALRDELRLEAGDTLELQTEGERVTLRPIRSSTRLRKDRGVWVLHTGEKITAAVTDKVLQDIREQRSRDILGNLG
jgi:AbrB family transcriptional regulator (stage V sporulation protein T)